MVEVDFVNQIYNKYLENKLAHAFLIETNDIESCFNELLLLIKKINCSDEYLDDCDKCNICHLIDSNNLPSLQIIEPVGKFIKKEQIVDLKNKFKYKPIYSKNNIYIIKNAEKLNTSSANTMLKFIEEPNTNIIGFFITTSRDNVIPTIKSRCQIYTSNYDLKTKIDNYEQLEELVYNYIFNIEQSTSNGLLYNKEVGSNELISKNNLDYFFDLIFHKYREALSKFLSFNEEINKYDFLIETNDVNKIIKKMRIIDTTISKLAYNINVDLLLDKFVIEMRKI